MKDLIKYIKLSLKLKILAKEVMRETIKNPSQPNVYKFHYAIQALKLKDK